MFQASARGDWNRAVTSKHVLKGVEISKWSLICPSKEQRVAKALSDTILQQGPKMGIKLAQPDLVLIPNDRPEAYLSAMRDAREGTQIVSIQDLFCAYFFDEV